MIRKTLLAIAAAATLTLGIGAVTTPAQAYHRGVLHVFIDLPGVGYHHRGHRHYHCHVRKVWRHGHWVRVKNCHSHRHGHPHHR